jgi:hypothetical protein
MLPCAGAGRSRPAHGGSRGAAAGRWNEAADRGAQPKGITTVFTVRNADQDAVLAHVTIWADLGIPVTFFDLYPTGFDMQEIDLAEVIDGRLPSTATAGQDPTDSISPHGPLSQDVTFATCSGVLPQPEQLRAGRLHGPPHEHAGRVHVLRAPRRRRGRRTPRSRCRTGGR